MRQIKTYQELVRLASACLRPGVCTNTMITQSEYGAAVEGGTLWGEETEKNLFLLRERSGHFRLSFFISDAAEALPVLRYMREACPIVTELAGRAVDARIAATVGVLKDAGFVPVLERMRLSGKPVLQSACASLVLTVDESLQEAALTFVKENFSALTGCIPDKAEWLAAVESGQVLVTTDERGVAGLLHFAVQGKIAEIRHLAIRSDLRGQGQTKPLLERFAVMTQGERAVVWTGKTLLAAQRVYERAGFSPDGRESVVLMKESIKKGAF